MFSEPCDRLYWLVDTFSVCGSSGFTKRAPRLPSKRSSSPQLTYCSLVLGKARVLPSICGRGRVGRVAETGGQQQLRDQAGLLHGKFPRCNALQLQCSAVQCGAVHHPTLTHPP